VGAGRGRCTRRTSLQIGEVRAARLRAAALDEERGDQPPVRVLVELGHAELAARQPVDGRGRQRRRGRHAEDVALRESVTTSTLERGCDGTRRASPRLRDARMMYETRQFAAGCHTQRYRALDLTSDSALVAR
jgi:hypothetical protein